MLRSRPSGLGDLADDGVRAGLDGAAQARAGVALPLTRDYGSGDVGDPWVHRTEPRIEAAFVAARPGDVRIIPAGRAMAATSGSAWVTGGAWSNALARWGSRTAAELDLVAGAVGNDQRALPALRARTAVSGACSRCGRIAAWSQPGPPTPGSARRECALRPGNAPARRGARRPARWRRLARGRAPRRRAHGASQRLLAASLVGPVARCLGAHSGAPAPSAAGADMDLDAQALVAAVGPSSCTTGAAA